MKAKKNVCIFRHNQGWGELKNELELFNSIPELEFVLTRFVIHAKGPDGKWTRK